MSPWRTCKQSSSCSGARRPHPPWEQMAAGRFQPGVRPPSPPGRPPARLRWQGSDPRPGISAAPERPRAQGRPAGHPALAVDALGHLSFQAVAPEPRRRPAGPVSEPSSPRLFNYICNSELVCSVIGFHRCCLRSFDLQDLRSISSLLSPMLAEASPTCPRPRPCGQRDSGSGLSGG